MTAATAPTATAPVQDLAAARADLVQEVQASQKRSALVMGRITDITGLTSSGLILLGLASASWLLGYVVGGRPLYLFAYGAGLVLVLSWLYGRRTPPLEGERSDVRARLREGDAQTVGISLTAQRRLTTLILEEKLPASLGVSPRVPIAELAEGESAGHSYSLTCRRRGVYTLGPLVVRWGDPFGLTQRKRAIADSFEMYVHPRIEPATDRPLTRLWEDPPQRPPFSRPWPSGLDFYGMRPYVPGDDLRRIVWRAYARTGSLLVREAEQGVTDKLCLLIDQGEGNHSGGVISESFETAMRVAASVGVHFLREGYTVTTEGTEEQICQPLRGGGAQIALLDSLARCNPTRGDIDDLIHRVGIRLVADTEVIVVTPLVTRKAVTALRLLVDRGISVKVVALVWDDEAVDNLAVLTSLGIQVVEIGPHTNLTMALKHEVGGGNR